MATATSGCIHRQMSVCPALDADKQDLVVGREVQTGLAAQFEGRRQIRHVVGRGGSAGSELHWASDGGSCRGPRFGRDRVDDDRPIVTNEPFHRAIAAPIVLADLHVLAVGQHLGQFSGNATRCCRRKQSVAQAEDEGLHKGSRVQGSKSFYLVPQAPAWERAQRKVPKLELGNQWGLGLGNGWGGQKGRATVPGRPAVHSFAQRSVHKLGKRLDDLALRIAEIQFEGASGRAGYARGTAKARVICHRRHLHHVQQALGYIAFLDQATSGFLDRHADWSVVVRRAHDEVDLGEDPPLVGHEMVGEVAAGAST